MNTRTHRLSDVGHLTSLRLRQRQAAAVALWAVAVDGDVRDGGGWCSGGDVSRGQRAP